MRISPTLAIVCSGLLAAGAGCKKKDEAKPQTGGGGATTTATTGSGAAGSGAGAGTMGSAGANTMGSAGDGSAAAGSGAAAAPADKRVVIKDAGFLTPESVLHDAAADVYLVANINGEPAGADDNGFISKVSPDGKVAELKWIDGSKPDVKLDAPKGMAISGDILWVADITVVRKFDAKTGAPKGEVKVPGASFLNDVAAAEGGGVYVGDTGVNAKFEPTGTDAVYHIGKDGKVKPLVKAKDLGGPNGLAFANGSVWVNTFGSGELYEVTMKGDKGEKKPGVKLPKGQLDGLVVKDDGELLISSWEGKAVYAGKPGGEWKAILSDVEAPADIGWDSKRKVLLVPQFTGNALILLPL
jgi:SMP-30/Gluconolactonase/LRE-like region